MTDREDGRERAVVGAFVELSNELVGDYDVLEMLSRLTKNCVGLLDVASAGLLLADGNGVLHVAAASSERTHQLEMLQVQRDEGPCLDCYRNEETVIAADLDVEGHRWPNFSRAARSIGLVSVHAVPMRLRDSVLGTLGLFGAHPGRLDDDDLALAQALAHVASVALVNEKAAADQSTVNGQLQHALSSRVILEQAKGVVAHAGEIDMDVAFEVLRRYARDHNQRLSPLAARVVNREVTGADLLEHARSVSVLP